MFFYLQLSPTLNTLMYTTVTNSYNYFPVVAHPQSLLPEQINDSFDDGLHLDLNGQTVEDLCDENEMIF